MTRARSEQIDLNVTPFYHCVSRCVRQAYLNGFDALTGRDYSHRKAWIVEEIRELGSIFSLQVCAYAVMCNHYHLVLHVDDSSALEWSQEEVLEQWKKLFKRSAKRFEKRIKRGLAQKEIDKQIQTWRERLFSISWFMRCLNERIARKANQEDNVCGRFWDGRFKSQALLDEAALLSAMVYVDLNPVRANIANTPEDSEFTSIYARIQDHQTQQAKLNEGLAHKVALDEETQDEKPQSTQAQPPELMRFADESSDKPSDLALPIHFKDYLQLVDETGRIIREDKRGAISGHLAPILERLGLESKGWVQLVKGLETNFSFAVGSEFCLAAFHEKFRHAHHKGRKHSRVCYSTMSA